MTLQHEKLVPVATGMSEIEGQLLVNLLKEHSIPATMTGGITSQFRAEAPGVVQVMVMQDRLSAAQALIEEHDRESSCSDPVVYESDAPAAESSIPQLWLTSFGFWTLVIGNLLAIVGILMFWFIR